MGSSASGGKTIWETKQGNISFILGKEGIRFFNTLEVETPAGAYGNDLDDFSAISNYYTPYKNETCIRYIFVTTNQLKDQTVDD